MKANPLLLLVMALPALVGCTSSMALTEKTKEIDTSEKSIALLTLRMSNAVKPGYEPFVSDVTIVREDGETERFSAPRPHRWVDDQFSEYLLSFALIPGNYEVGRVRGGASGFLIRGNFAAPAGLRFSLGPDEIVHLGELEMVNRPRNDDEPRAGSIFPLIDQAVTGFASGTFDVSAREAVEGAFAFQERFPVLQQRTIRSASLHP